MSKTESNGRNEGYGQEKWCRRCAAVNRVLADEPRVVACEDCMVNRAVVQGMTAGGRLVLKWCVPCARANHLDVLAPAVRPAGIPAVPVPAGAVAAEAEEAPPETDAAESGAGAMDIEYSSQPETDNSSTE